ncbi:MAG: DUF308 domain-containing protein [Woeseiaceae bacterium]
MSEDKGKPGEHIRAAASQARSGVTDKLGHVRRALLMKAVLIAIAGVCVIAWPQASAQYLLWVIAALLVLDGIAGVLSLFSAGERGAYFFQGLISLAVGAALFLWPDASIRTLVLVFGAWAILTGVALLWTLKDVDQDADFRQVQKIAGIVLGLVGLVLIFWPGFAGVTLSWLIGIAALLMAAVLFWLSSRIDKLRDRVAGAD